MGIDLRVRVNGRRNIKLDQAEFVYIVPLILGIKMETCTLQQNKTKNKIKKDIKSLDGWFQAFAKRWYSEKELALSGIP